MVWVIEIRGEEKIPHGERNGWGRQSRNINIQPPDSLHFQHTYKFTNQHRNLKHIYITEIQNLRKDALLFYKTNKYVIYICQILYFNFLILLNSQLRFHDF